MARVAIPEEADAVFEGGGVKGIALVGGISAAERAGVREWKNVAGASAGAIVAALLAVGYRAERDVLTREDTPTLREIVGEVVYRDFPDYGRGGRIRGVVESAPKPRLGSGQLLRRVA